MVFRHRHQSSKGWGFEVFQNRQLIVEKDEKVMEEGKHNYLFDIATRIFKGQVIFAL